MSLFPCFNASAHPASPAECIYSRKWAPRPTSEGKSNRPLSGSSTISNGDLPRRKELSKEDDAKLIFGTIFSLRNIVKKLGGDDDKYVHYTTAVVEGGGLIWAICSFLSYRTNEYKLHYYETPTRLKFVMITDTKMSNMRIALHQIWVNLYVEYVVKNPLAPVEHIGGIGVANELFEFGLERFMVSCIRYSCVPKTLAELYLAEHRFASMMTDQHLQSLSVGRSIIITKR
jgi:trafficking protein particle complex subunit 1